jgi:hypothetical protein
MTVAQALKVLFDSGLMTPTCDFFTDGYYVCSPAHLTCEPMFCGRMGNPVPPEGLQITFCDGSRARYFSGGRYVVEE